MKNLIFSTFIIAIFIDNIQAQQFDLSAEVRPRYENKHGYRSLLATDANSSNFVSQRTRLNFNFEQDKIRLGVTLQNVRVWGDVSTLSNDDNATALHETWAEAILNDKISFKLGRQEIVYDDHRIFGNVGWAQQARSHDAFLFKYTPNVNNRLDIGMALNSDTQSNLDNLYSNAAGYKTFQYAWYHGDFNKVGFSFLLLNIGIEYLNANDVQTINHMQTIGPRLTYKEEKFTANAAIYLQTGKSLNRDVSALYYTANLGYKISDEFSTSLGFEYLSGKDNNETVNNKIKSFAPLFGTNHKFNGWMDYFYVGNHSGSVGLSDINATLAYQKDKFSAKLVPHIFTAAADIYNGSDKMSSNLGTELDLLLGYKMSKNMFFNAGYSKMFASESMEMLKGGDKDENNSWAWVMVTFKPKLFSTQSN